MCVRWKYSMNYFDLLYIVFQFFLDFDESSGNSGQQQRKHYNMMIEVWFNI